MAANVSVPNTFSNATTADAAQVNANFAALVAWINTNAVHLDGSKAFTAVPSGPATNPTDVNHLTRKAYVDGFFPVVTANIADASISTAKLQDSAVTAIKLAAGSVSNAKLATGSGEPGGGWTTYTPTLSGTGWAIGNGSATGGWKQIGKTIHFWARVVFGTTSTFGASNRPSVTLPVQGQTANTFHTPLLTGECDLAGSVFMLRPRITAGLGSVEFYAERVLTAPGFVQLVGVQQGNPGTFANNDVLFVRGTYEGV